MSSTFIAFMASTVHELKNSLGTLIAGIDKLQGDIKTLTAEERKQLDRLQRMAFQINNGLMQLLSFYKVENNQYPLQLVGHSALDFLEEQLIYMKPFVEERELELVLECSESLEAYFDAPLVTGVIRDAMTNACRYAKSQVVCRAMLDKGGLLLQIEDNGPGYPANMLGKLSERQPGVDFHTGSTGLGLYFGKEVAKLHKKNNVESEIWLDNDGALHGARFNWWMPQ
jgi:signal transduction histidine kinase